MAVNVNNPTASGMILTFDDEFNSNSTSSNGAASGTQWNNHWWYDGANPGAITVSNGVLNLASGGEMSTVNSSGQGFAQKYGYFEIDMKLPAGVGTWPAFFLMSQQHVVSGANPASEIDIIEAQGNKPFGYYTTLHSATGSGHDTFNPSNTYTGNVSSTDLSAGFHRYGVLWSPTSNQLTYYLDGNPVATATKYGTTDYSPDMLLIDNALGDIGLGGNSPTPGHGYGPLQIDYVRAYQFTGEGATAINPQALSAAAGQTDPTALANAAGGGGGGGAGDPIARVPTLSVTNASGAEGSSIALSITAAQAAANLATADLTVTVSNLNGATLNHGTEANGVYTLHAADLAGLTVTPGATFTGTLALHVTATDTEPSSTTTASSAVQTLDVTVTAPVTTGPASPNGTIVTGTHGAIVTAAHNTFAIDAAGQITENGTVLAATNSVTELAYVNSTVYQEATTQNLWWSFKETTNQWTQATDPLPGGGAGDPLAVAPTLSVVNASGNEGGTIALSITAAQAAANLATADLTVTVSNLNGATLNHGTESNGVYTLHAADLAGLTVTPGATFTGTLALHVTATDTEPSSTTTASSAVQTLDVTVAAPTASPNGTIVTGTHGAIVTAAHNAFAIDAAGQITENGTVLAATNSVTELAYVNSTVYQEATTQNLWWSFKETTNQWTQATDPLAVSGGGAPHASAPTLSVFQASGSEGGSIPLFIQASQASATLSPADLSITVQGIGSATLNHGTETNGVYTLKSSDLAGLTLTPVANFTGSLPLHVTATDTEATSSASSVTATLNVSVNAPVTGNVVMQPTYNFGSHSLYLLNSTTTANEHIANFNPSTDILDLAPFLSAVGYHGTNPIADHVVNLELASNGGTAVMFDPTGASPTHGATVITLDHVLPHSMPATDIWH